MSQAAGWQKKRRACARLSVRCSAVAGSDVLAHRVAGEAADDEVFAELGDLALDQIADGDVGILDEGLLEQAVVGVELVHLAVDDLLNDVVGLALDLFSGDFAFLGDQIGRDFVAAEVTRVGGEKEISVNVRVIAATNKDLLKEIDAGNFRMDLYHRLSVIIIHVPPLVERKADIPVLAKQFCDEICGEYNMPVKKITDDAMEALKGLPWTGNIRELRNMVERLIILSDKSITDKDVRAFANPGSITTVVENTKAPAPSADSDRPSSNGSPIADYDDFPSFQDFKDHTEMEFIKYKLEKNGWNVSKTADEIDIQRSHLYSKIEKFGLKRES